MVNNVYKEDILKYEQKDEEMKQKHIQFLKRRNEMINKKLNILKNIQKPNRFNNILSFGK